MHTFLSTIFLLSYMVLLAIRFRWIVGIPPRMKDGLGAEGVILVVAITSWAGGMWCAWQASSWVPNFAAGHLWLLHSNMPVMDLPIYMYILLVVPGVLFCGLLLARMYAWHALSGVTRGLWYMAAIAIVLQLVYLLLVSMSDVHAMAWQDVFLESAGFEMISWGMIYVFGSMYSAISHEVWLAMRHPGVWEQARPMLGSEEECEELVKRHEEDSV